MSVAIIDYVRRAPSPSRVLHSRARWVQVFISAGTTRASGGLAFGAAEMPSLDHGTCRVMHMIAH